MIDELDEFTDERKLSIGLFHRSVDGQVDRSRYLRLLCSRGARGIVVLHVGAGTPVLGASRRERFLADRMPEVTTRFDADPATSARWIAVGDEAVSDDAFDRMLDSALASSHLIAKVESSQTASFDLVAARSDLADFKQRCEAWRQITSENPIGR